MPRHSSSSSVSVDLGGDFVAQANCSELSRLLGMRPLPHLRNSDIANFRRSSHPALPPFAGRIGDGHLTIPCHPHLRQWHNSNSCKHSQDGRARQSLEPPSYCAKEKVAPRRSRLTMDKMSCYCEQGPPNAILTCTIATFLTIVEQVYIFLDVRRLLLLLLVPHRHFFLPQRQLGTARYNTSLLLTTFISLQQLLTRTDIVSPAMFAACHHYTTDTHL